MLATPTEPRPKPKNVEECLTRLKLLDREEAGLSLFREQKEMELEASRERGDYQQAALLMAELDDLNGPRLKRIQNDRAATNLILWSALAAELERQADRLESVVPDQQKKEAEALSRLENLIQQTGLLMKKSVWQMLL
jgi:hypothetical protein